MIYFNFFSVDEQTIQKRKMEFTPRAAKFFATVLASCILNKCDIINNNVKQQHFIYISHINLSV